jgi:hypothetical protein
MVLWSVALNGALGFFDAARAVDFDLNGDIFVAGTLDESDQASSFTVCKILSTGAVKWCSTRPGSLNSFLEARAVQVAVDGNPIAVGIADDPGPVHLSVFLVEKFDTETGNRIWATEMTGDTPFYHEGHAFALAPNGDVFAAGSMQNPVTSQDLTLVKLDGQTGQEDRAWRKVITGTGLR